MKKTDRELLELAAKAFWADDEVSTRFDDNEEGLLYIHADNQDHNGRDREFVWNPLEHGEQALQIVAKLKLHIGMESHVANAWAPTDFRNFQTVNFVAYDEEAALRRAIVLAAAAAGEKVPS
ncbi:hypothetical protein J2W35_003250 [Variovorax boronicumulans]|uniref:hypothetical protein n=1 Tax=Variovorax boronicumulans TaxID=436515 RepID=UPI00278840CE|nr:hypothetical protein [Variovorax boronicumulans]MDQ0082891.1 hypothetical protein [Variovorax boronicumulans]